MSSPSTSSIKHQEASVEDGKLAKYRINAKISFALE